MGDCQARFCERFGGETPPYLLDFFILLVRFFSSVFFLHVFSYFSLFSFSIHFALSFFAFTLFPVLFSSRFSHSFSAQRFLVIHSVSPLRKTLVLRIPLKHLIPKPIIFFFRLGSAEPLLL